MKQLANVDVLVVGGGPAGIGAALAAARRGADTLLIENHAFFGGIASFCMGMCLNQMRPDDAPRSDIHELLIESLANYGPRAYAFSDVGLLKGGLYTNVEYLKVAVLDALESVGCRYLVHTRCVDTLTEGDRVTGVVVATKRGLATIAAKAVVDCTGDADVATFAGAETLQDPVGSPMTLCFDISNIDVDAAIETMGQSGFMKELADRARDTFPLIPSTWGVRPFPVSNALYINHAGTRVIGPMDATDPWVLTEAETFSRRQIIQMVEAMRAYGGETLANTELSAAGPQIGVRETRRVLGAYILTEEDSLNGAKFDDGVAWRSGMLDIGHVHTVAMPTHDVPYRALLPVQVDGLLVGGRCISTDHRAASAGKSMGNCLATGHAAGLAAAMCAEQGVVPRELDVSALRDALRGDGVDLDKAGQAPDLAPHFKSHNPEKERWDRAG